MHPILILILIVGAIVGNIALNLYLGHLTGKALLKWRKNGGAATRFGRIVSGYQLWSILAGLSMCAAIFSGAAHFFFPMFLIGLMCFPLVIASDLEPPVKSCKSCGR